MNFSKRSPNLVGVHALLSPSSYHWVNYTDEKLDRVFHERQQAQLGTRLHALAHEMIALRIKMAEEPRTLNMYVNDGIGFRMTCEQLLYYSENCFGHADSICFRNNKLRIHDYKSGVTPASMTQLLIYVALFCLEYNFKPFDIEIALRIYQNDAVDELIPDPVDIMTIMSRIVTFSKRIDDLRMEDA